jgi:hypothetical protein
MNEDNLCVSYTIRQKWRGRLGRCSILPLVYGQSRSDIVRILQCPQNTT